MLPLCRTGHLESAQMWIPCYLPDTMVEKVNAIPLACIRVFLNIALGNVENEQIIAQLVATWILESRISRRDECQCGVDA